MLAEMHREDVKAAIRKARGTVAQFERDERLPVKSVNEVLRGRANARVSQAIEKLLTEGEGVAQPEYSGSSEANPTTHRLNKKGR